MKRFAIALAVLLYWSTASATVSVLNGGLHADGDIAPAITAALGAGHIDTDIFVDTTGDPPPLYNMLAADLTNASNTYFKAADGVTAVNHQPYGFANLSTCCWNTDGGFSVFIQHDVELYPTLLASSTVFAWSYGFNGGDPRPLNTPPPILTTTGSAPDSFDGHTGGGIEFGLTASYLGLRTWADSWVSAELAGFFAAMKFQHPTWSVFDIKAAFRQTASNWATGYNPNAYGYGFLNYASATALASPSALYLQPPGLRITNQGFYATITLAPFRQARRDHEVVYSVSSSYSWPVKNEYTAADITASGGTLIYTSNGTDTTPTFTYLPATSGTVTFVAFTVDASGNLSRAENAFSKNTQSFLIGSSCLK